ncbi:hypothetical protein ACN2MM_09395 [Alkalilimnicola ehrlichii MLHE-1]|uniref:Uncharacterized protein n=1 Tax=Alkalilimnicola ehrlichii (strain ATCC BAA-1101 / DSM 17681 / MLHE-1) TaxID=187272 RepID=Q0A7W1_ALKEH|nr:hypothetical protein [Alkalilimnicola ehrlichii]ABI57076.1 hypothetical protein Mlg_1730 [Alkalilimnicola ehrlichii MLHE-1]
MRARWLLAGTLALALAGFAVLSAPAAEPRAGLRVDYSPSPGTALADPARQPVAALTRVDANFNRLRRYSTELTLTYPDAPAGDSRHTVRIRVVRVHPHVAIHYFKRDRDAYMYLNHGLDDRGYRYYHAVQFPVIGMKTYITEHAMDNDGEIAPRELLDEDARRILALQLSEIDRYGGIAAYAAMLEKRGYFPATGPGI